MNSYQKDNHNNNISFGLDLSNFAVLLRTLWHCIRWDDIMVEPDKDICVHDSNGRPCFRKTLNIDDDDDDVDVSGASGRHDDNKPYSVRRIVEIQPLDRFWLQANYKVRITTTYPARSNSSRRRKAAESSNRGRSTRGPCLQDSPEPDESTSRRKGRRGGQRNAQGGKDPDYDPAVDEGWRVGVPCSSRRQSRTNFRSYGRSSRGSFCDSDDDGDTEFCGGRRDLQSQRNEVSVEEKWMSEDAVFLWEIDVFMNSLLPPKSNYPPISDSSVSKIDPNDKTSQYVISSRLAALPPDSSSNGSASATVTTTEVNNSLISPSNIEGYVEKNGFLYDGGQPKGFLSNSSSSRSRSTLASALQSGRITVNSRSRSDDRSMSNNINTPRPLSPNTLEAKARARSIAATNAARASVAARRARFERALLEQRVRSLKSQFCSRKRLIFNWAKSLADIAVNEIKGAQQISKADKSNENSSKKLEQSSTQRHHHQTGEKLPIQKSRSNIVNQLNKSSTSSSSSTLLPKKKIGRPSASSSSGDDENKNPNLINNKQSNQSELLANNRIPRKSALNHEFIKLSKKTQNNNRLTMKLSIKQSKKDNDDNTTTITTHSSCSTASTSPGLGDDYENNIYQQKSTAPTKTNRSVTTKTKRLKHESTNSDASEHNYSVTESIKSPRSSVSGGGSKRGSSNASGTGRNNNSNKGGGRVKLSEKSDKNEAPTESITSVLQNVSSNSPVYCVCKTPYNPLREYIGCDLCRDWFHFECVGLDPKDSDKLGDSWHCPDCKQAELKANEMLYCVCRTPYEPTRVYIACDGCDEWYHPECVGLTPEQAVNHTDTYLCPTCCQLSQRTTNTTTTTTKSSGKSKKSKGSNKNHSAVTVVDQTAATKTIYETNLTSDRIKKLINLIEELQQHKMSWPFIHTPDPLKFPMARSLDDAFNLPSVIINLKTEVYKTLGDFSFDMNRLFTNSRLIYPKDTPEFNCTEIVEALFVQKMKQFKEENL
ncbi:bromodomain containing protein,putative [Schistosoma mansoni]|uniref:bromodomain containing protein,putative n=1 Tax=Schistosoma mansoni TaxID=6183 RepID=UPI00022C8407|nr:bromodomain containing protein,putative [Schistosoma mansoni]|eukprot:XP_018645722.1 bromodomain containing protein,putative [Schistosoma mansoni]